MFVLVQWMNPAQCADCACSDFTSCSSGSVVEVGGVPGGVVVVNPLQQPTADYPYFLYCVYKYETSRSQRFTASASPSSLQRHASLSSQNSPVRHRQSPSCRAHVFVFVCVHFRHASLFNRPGTAPKRDLHLILCCASNS